MSSAEFSMWLQLCELDPWDDHADFGYGTIAAQIANWAGMVRADRSQPLQPFNFMPHLPQPVIEEPDPMEFFRAVK